MDLVKKYIDSSAHTELLVGLRSLVLSNGLLKEEFKWSMPVYTKNGKDVCYIKGTKNGANIGFTKGATLTDVTNILEGSGKDMRHIKISSNEKLKQSAAEISTIIDQACSLNY